MHRATLLRAFASSAAVLALLVALGCATDSAGRGDRNTELHQDAAAERLWRRKCVDCHGLHAPSRHSDADWKRIMDDMAQEAHLTAAEKATILAFLQARND